MYMRTYDLITPEGTRDLLFDECRIRRIAESKLSEIFTRKGYSEVVTPGLEFYDVFNRGSRYFKQESMYKLVDSKGRLLVMRPDSTMPIARLVATRLRDGYFPLKLFYNQSIYTSNRSLAGRSDEVIQSGIEIIGGQQRRADLEALTIAIDTLSICKQSNFRLEIGNIAFFKELVSLLNTSDENREQIRDLIEAKNYPALNELLDSIGQSDVVTALKQLPRLFGGVEVLDKAATLYSNEITNAVISSLREVYNDLCSLGLGDSVTIDLGLVNRTDYYTGLIFRGYAQGIGEAVLSGGRYDKLIAEFGFDMPATGFAVNVDAIARVMQNSDDNVSVKPDLIVYGEDGFEMQSILYADKLISTGMTVENAISESLKEVKNYALARGILRIDIVGESVKTIEVGDENANS